MAGAGRPLVVATLRTVLTFLALLVTAASSIVLVRMLDPASYAAYQALTKRVTRYALPVYGVFAGWIYRYAAQRIPGTVSATICVAVAASLAGSLAAAVVSVKLGLHSASMISALLALGLYTAFAVLQIPMNAARPVRFSVVTLAYRLVYSSLVVLLVYLAGAGLLGALLSVVVAASVGVGLQLLWLRSLGSLGSGCPADLLREWVRGVHVSLLGVSASLVASLDIAAAYPLAGSMVVAAYFAATAFLALFREAVGTGIGYISAYVLGGGSSQTALSALRLSLLATAPLAGYALVYPDHLIHLLNPQYAWASAAVRIASAAVYVGLLASGYISLAAGLIRGRVEETSHELAKINAAMLLSQSFYLVLLVVGLYVLEDPALEAAWWASSLLLSSIVTASVGLLYLSGDARSGALDAAKWSVVYLASALTSAAVAAPRLAPQRRFWDEVVVLLPSVAIHLTLYVLMVASLDAFARKVLRRVPQALLELLAGSLQGNP
ncbi:MAG: hypothetical protein ABWW70_01365 [Thermoproteota archaeon]